MTGTEAADLTKAIDHLANVLHPIFALPSASDSAAIWAIGFVPPLTLYVVASMVGKLVNFWR